MIKILRILGFLLRIIFHYSEYTKSLEKLILFPNLVDSQITISENNFLFSYLSRPFFSENYFSVFKFILF